MKNLFLAIKSSFLQATKGEESIKNLIWWGITSYLLAIFFEDVMVYKISFAAIESIIEVVFCLYFSWHIYAVRKCTPKKPVLTKEEEKIIKLQKQRDRYKKIARKFFLQESIFNIENSTILIVIDLYFLVSFVQKILIKF